MADEPQRPAQDYSGAQMGDHQQRDAAGRDIVHGVDADKTLDLVRFFWEDRQQRDIRRAELDDALQDMRDTIELYRSTITQRINALVELMEQQAYEQRRTRRWLAGLTLAIIVVLAVLAGLVWREAGMLAASAAFDALALR